MTAGTERLRTDPATDGVLRDLVDAAVGEDLVTVRAPGADGWGRVGGLRARLRPGGALQRWRLAGGPLLDDAGDEVPPGPALAALGLDGPGAASLWSDLTDAREHAAALRRGFERCAPSVDLLGGERLAATRGRPFHPTGRAVSGWDVPTLEAFGPMRVAPLAVSWVGVRRDRLRHGPGERSSTLHETVLSAGELERLREALARAGLDEQTVQPVPVHPWQAEHVLPVAFADEVGSGAVVPLGVEAGRFRPTVALRTLVWADDPERHLKLPLGVATLGATRLLPPRYLGNGDRAEAMVRAVVGSHPVLARAVDVCDEGTWVGWSDGHDEFADRPGHLAAQVRAYPAGSLDGTAVAMAALAADGWDALGPALGGGDPVALFAGLADAFVETAVAFLAHGILPELHGQNVVARFDPRGRVLGFVLRDHDTVRVFPDWMRRVGVADPEYRVRPGAHQTLRLDTATELIGYAQTLGLQVNLFGVADALARRYALDERELWACQRRAVERALRTVDPPAEVGEVIGEALLRAPRWPGRTVLGPLLAAGRSSSVSMPAGVGSVPNPLLAAPR